MITHKSDHDPDQVPAVGQPAYRTAHVIATEYM
jgi:hypothetical protein